MDRVRRVRMGAVFAFVMMVAAVRAPAWSFGQEGAGPVEKAFAALDRPLPKGASRSAQRVQVLQLKGLPAFLGSEKAVPGFSALLKSFREDPKDAGKALDLLAKHLALVPRIQGWDGYSSVELVKFARSAAPASGERLRKAYVGVIGRTLAKGKMEAQFRKWWQRSLDVLTGPAFRGVLIGHPAPRINFLWCAPSGAKSLQELGQDKVVVLDFWATWCRPCIAAFPEVAKLAERFKGRPVVFVGVTSLQGFVIDPDKGRIDCKDDPSKELGFMPDIAKRLGITWESVVGDKDCFNPGFGIQEIPHLAVIDRKGIVRHNGIGMKRLGDAIEALLKE